MMSYSPTVGVAGVHCRAWFKRGCWDIMETPLLAGYSDMVS